MMKEAKISSIFAAHDDRVVGIITERDIVHKFSMLEKKDKLALAVYDTTCNVCCLEHLELDINKMFLSINYDISQLHRW